MGPAERGGFGLRGMHERAERLKGTAEHIERLAIEVIPAVRDQLR